MLKNPINSSVVFDHFLMMAPTLLMRSWSHKLAHDPIQMPFSTALLLSLQDLTKFKQKSYIFLVFFRIPVWSWELALHRGRFFKTIDDLFGSKHPRLKSFKLSWGICGICGRIELLTALLGVAFSHFYSLIILKILLKPRKYY